MKEFFTHEEDENSTKAQDVLDEILKSEDVKNAILIKNGLEKCIKKQLRAIIKEKIKDIKFTDWRYCFINEPKMFDYMANNCLRFYMKEGEKGVRLLSGVVNRGVFMPSYLYYYAIKENNALYEEDEKEKCVFLKMNGKTIKFENNAFVVSKNKKVVGNVEIKENEKATFNKIKELLN